jgi:RimJ/RimL family protein N-acetyltransferase
MSPRTWNLTAPWRRTLKSVAMSAGSLVLARLRKRSFAASSCLPLRIAWLWATVYKPEGVYIGYCGIYPHFGEHGPIPGEGTLAFYLARPYWGRGLATEAGDAFLQFGWNELGLKRIVASVEIGNDASVRVLEKLGLKRVGTEHGPHRSYYAYEMDQAPRGQ